MADGLIGQSLRRVEDQRFLTGQGRYVDDIDAPGALHGVMLRSPHAHAEIRRIDAAAALAAPGVRAVFTAADLADIGPLPCVAAIVSDPPFVAPPRQVLASGRVRHVGEGVAFVVAESAIAARDAAELIDIDYQPLPAVVDAATALADGAPQLWPQAPGNCAFRFHKGDRDAVAAAMAQAAHRVTVEVFNNRIAAAPIEPRAAIARYDDGRYELLCNGQGVHGMRNILAQHVLRIPPETLRIIAPDVGGGFGMKNFVFAEHVLLLLAARRLGAPVRWLSEAGEDLQASVHARDLRSTATLALDAEGHFLALQVEGMADLGAYASSFGAHCTTNAASTAMGGAYAIPAISYAVRGAYTNTTPIDAYRGAGKPESNYTVERVIEAAARQTGIDAVELRRRNLLRDGIRASAMGMQVEAGNYVPNLDRAEQLADRAGFAARKAAAAARGLLLGQGITHFMETARGQPNEDAALRFDADGRIAVVVGTQSNGQGHETSFVQLVAARLGLPMERFRYVQADTAALTRGAGHGGARSLHLGGGALVQAADAVLSKARLLAAHLLQSTPAAMDYADGRFTVHGSERGIALAELAQAARDAGNLPEGMAPGLDAEVTNQCDIVTFPGGTHVAEVEVDRETGAIRLTRYLAVDDYGNLLNPLLTESQVQGGVVQGIGQALLENIAYDGDGQMLSATYMDYCLPRAADLPDIEVVLEGRPTTGNPLGSKGSGQAGAIASPQAVMAAVLDALAPLGVTTIDMPATPYAIWKAITGPS